MNKKTLIKMKIENVKAIFKDKDQLFLVGLSSYPSVEPNYSFLGGHTEKGETPFETLGREIMEETSMVLELSYDDKKGFYLKDPVQGQTLDLTFQGIKSIDKKWYVFFDLETQLTPYMNQWKLQFIKNQKKIIQDAVLSLQEIYPSIKWNQMIQLFLARKFGDLKSILFQRLTKSEIRQVIVYMREIGFYLENLDLVLVSKDELNKKLYEKEVLKYL